MNTTNQSSSERVVLPVRAARSLEAQRARVYDGAEAVADVLDEVADAIRREVKRARERPGANVAGQTAEHYLVDAVLGATMNMMPNLRLDRLMERLMTVAASEAELAREEAVADERRISTP